MKRLVPILFLAVVGIGADAQVQSTTIRDPLGVAQASVKARGVPAGSNDEPLVVTPIVPAGGAPVPVTCVSGCSASTGANPIQGQDGGYPVLVTGTFAFASATAGPLDAGAPTQGDQIAGQDPNGRLISVQLDSQGNLYTNGSRVTQPVSGTVSCNSTQTTSPWTDDVTQFGGTNISTGTGTSGAGIPRVTVSSDSSMTCNAGTNLNTSALATSANQTNGTQQTEINNGANVAAVKAASTAPATTDPALVCSLSPNSNATLSCIPGDGGIFQVSGSVTCNAGTNLNTSTLATSANQTNGTQETEINNGANIMAVKAASTAAAAADPSAVVALSPNTPLPAGSNALGSVSVSNTVTVSGSINVSQFGGSAVVTGTGASGSGIPRVTVSNDSNVLATESGTWTVTANAGTNLNTSALALNSTLTGGTQQCEINNGANVAAVKAASTAPVATDPALVCSLSPNSATTITNESSAQTTGTLTYTSANNAVTYSGTATFPGVAIQIISSSITGSPVVTFEGSPDTGTTWYAVNARKITTAGVSSAWATTYSAANETVVFHIGNLPGFNQVRARVSTTGTAGTGAVTINLVNVDMDTRTWTAVNGGAAAPYSVQVQQLTAADLLATVSWGGALTGGTAGTLPIGGITNQGAATGSQNPVQVAGQSQANGTTPTPVATGRVSEFTTDLIGNQFVIPGSPHPESCNVTTTSGATTSTSCFAGLDAGLTHFLTLWYCQNLQLDAGTATTIRVVAGAGPNCDGGTVAMFGYYNQGCGLGSDSIITMSFPTPVPVPSDYGVCFQGTSVAQCSAAGYVGSGP